ncbi:MAG TPA: hypothetical protein VGH99_07605 [Pseudonocardia sp.]|jgi:hypothetical protein
MTMMKMGAVLVSAAAAVVAFNPVAFAGENHHGHGHDHDRGDGRGHHRDGGDEFNGQSGLVNLQNLGVQVPVQLCNNSIGSGVLGLLSAKQSNRDSHDGDCDQSNSDD